ncbi:unnamed protein product [Rhizophagus irregularis]|nr:unnamed protein product [Rhizophagus irregularis]
MSSSEQRLKAEESRNHEVTKRIETPSISGFSFRIYLFLLDYVPGLTSLLLRNAELNGLGKLKLEECPTNLSLPLPKEYFGIEETKVVDGLKIFESVEQSYSGFLRASDLRKAYLTKRTTPLQICEILIGKLEESLKCNPPLNAIIKYDRGDIITQATASANRYASNCSLGPLDGVPVAIKDDMDVKGYETNVGTTFINRGASAQTDATIIKRLREKGAIIIGKTSMHEMAFGVTGNNPSVGTARNPYNINYYPGGSSSGSAAAVASGLCPIAIGSDTGGSIRIPSACCGIYGLKTTWGRFSAKGEFSTFPTLTVSGPIAATADDLALAYFVMAGRDDEDLNTYRQPLPTLTGLYNTKDLSDLKIGIYSEWNREVYNSAITLSLNDFIKKLQLRGAKIIEIDIPDLKEVELALFVTAGSELLIPLKQYKEDFHKFNCNTRYNAYPLESITTTDYVIAQQLRTRFMRSLSNLFNTQVNLILTPTTPITAPKIYSQSLTYGDNSNLIPVLTRFTNFVNFSGIPAVTIPAGYDNNQLPIGLQFVAKWFDEATLLRMAKVSEEILGNQRKSPNGFWFGDFYGEVL